MRRTGDCLPDNIPLDCIGLADAFQLFVRKVHPHIENMRPETLEEMTAQIEELEEGEALFRQELRDGKICALFEGLDGIRRRTASDDWAGTNALAGFRTNFVDWQRSFAVVPGPDTRIGAPKRRAPIFFERTPFERWLTGKSWQVAAALPQWESEPDKRDKILHRAQIGELTPEQAEAEAQKAGIGPLVEDPPALRFDPMKEPHWTLAMAFAWLISKDPERVRFYWNDYRRERWGWTHREYRLPPEGRVQAGWYLEQTKPASLHDVWVRESAMTPAADESAQKALETLWKALQAGQILATGIPYGQEQRREIPTFEWIDLSSIDYADGREEAIFSNAGVLRFQTVRVARTDVESIWPAPPSSAKAASDCKAFLIEKMRASPNTRLQTDAELWVEAKSLFPRLSRRSYKVVRSIAVGETGAHAWGTAGRPRGKR